MKRQIIRWIIAVATCWAVAVVTAQTSSGMGNRNNQQQPDTGASESGSSGMTGAGSSSVGGNRQPGQMQTFTGTVSNLQTNQQAQAGQQQTAFTLRSDQGNLAVEAGSQWSQKHSELNLSEGDTVQVRGQLSGFGMQRRILAEEITAHGKTVTLSPSQQPYRETGRESEQPQQQQQQQQQDQLPQQQPQSQPQPGTSGNGGAGSGGWGGSSGSGGSSQP